MRRCMGFLALAFLLLVWDARAEYLFVRIDLGNVYQNMPSGINAAGVGIQAPRPPGPGPGPGPRGKGGIGGGEGGQPVAPLPVPGVGAPMETGAEGPFVYGIFEVRKKQKPFKTDQGIEATAFEHAWSVSPTSVANFLTLPGWNPKIVKYVTIPKTAPAADYAKSFKKDLASKDRAKIADAARWAFEHGLNKEFHAAIDTLRKTDASHPIVGAYDRVKSGFKKAPASVEPAQQTLVKELAAEKFAQVSGDAGWCLAITNLPTDQQPTVKRRASRMEEAYEAFYYWFALRPGLPQPPLPQHRQLLIVTRTSEDYYEKHAHWGSTPFVGGGFTARRDNFVLSTWLRLDEDYRFFDANNANLWKTLQMSKDAFVLGTVWDKKFNEKDPFQRAYTQTLTLVQKAMEEENELETATHQGTRQMLFASGLLPRNVHTPEWIAQGLSGFFETSAGSPYRAVGLPSAHNLVAFKYLRQAKRLDKPGDTLRAVLSDRYFRDVHRLFGELDDAPDRDKLNQRIRDEMDIARSTAWALVYHVMKNKSPDLLLRYCQELNSLPRDLDLDGRALEACFAKAFGFGDARNPLRLDPVKTDRFAAEWFSAMSELTLESMEVQAELLEMRKLREKSEKGESSPAGPGGAKGGGGGGN